MKSVCIIGKGPSVLECKRDWVESFDQIAICNHVRFEGFEDLIGERADWWFRNWSCAKYPHDEIRRRGIKRVVFVAPRSSSAEIVLEKLPTFLKVEEFACIDWFLEYWKARPPTGLRALEYFRRKNYDRIGLVGHDLFEPGKQRYYFDSERIQRHEIEHGGKETKRYFQNVLNTHPSVEICPNRRMDTRWNSYSPKA